MSLRAKGRLLFCGLLLGFCIHIPATWSEDHPLEALSIQAAHGVFPGIDSFGELYEEIPVRSVLSGDKLVGYVFLTDHITPIPAYSGRPIRALVGIDTAARITGVEIVAHEEPILVIGITDSHIAAFVAQYKGLSSHQKVRIGAHERPGYHGVDGITGATITTMVINTSIMKSAHRVALAFNLPVPVSAIPAENGNADATSLADGGMTQPDTVNTATAKPEWIFLWREKSIELSLLGVALTVLLAILFFQDWLVVHAQLFHRVRIVYLLFTLFYLGWYCKAQLSVINLVAFMRILFGNFTWDTLLLDPVIFILWGFVATSILLWGRGVFCGWLCPFGALQELVYKVAEKLQLPNYEFPAMVHERLWAIKYFILIALVGVSLESMVYAAQIAEVEPFKTTFVMQFTREPQYVIYALILIAASVFNSKFYCKYLCPLGAALSFFTRFRIFDWLRRRKECGTPCQSCAAQCQISAIKPTGEIIDNECHYCLECQVTYWDEPRCPPLVDKRKKRESRQVRAAAIIARETASD